MKKNNVIYVLKIVLPLLLICIAVVAVLALVNMMTEPVIAQNNEEKFNRNLSKYYGPGITAEERNIEDLGENVKTAHTVRKDGAVIGYCFEVIGKGAYKNSITVLVALDEKGAVLGIANVKNGETPSLGGKVLAEGGVKDNYVGATADALPEGEQAFLSGATRTSNALKNAVNTAFDAYKIIKESEGAGV